MFGLRREKYKDNGVYFQDRKNSSQKHRQVALLCQRQRKIY